MATTFGYVEREADSYVNWADVGRNMSATIDNIQRVRDEKKGLIEKAYTEDLDYIQSRPSGEHETLNGWSLNFGNDSAENLKLKYSLLKQGKISVNEFVKFRQNLSDSVEKIYTVNGQLQEAFKKVNDRTKAGDNQELERATKVLLEKYGELENTLPYINGLTGSVAIGLTETVDEDGKQVRRIRKGDDAYLTPNQLQAAAMQEFNNFDPEPVMQAWADGTGKFKETLRSLGGESFSGSITSIEDITGDRWLQIAKDNNLSEDKIKQIQEYIDKFKAAEGDFIAGILENKFDASAIATERMGTNPKTGNPYTIVFSEKDQVSSDQIYVEKTKEGKFTPRFDTKFGKEQYGDMQEYLKGQLRVKYDRIVEQQTYSEQRKERPQLVSPTAPQMKRLEGIEDVKGSAKWIGQLYSGDNKVKQNALEILRNEPGVASARFVEERGVTALEIFNSLGKLSVIKITSDLKVAQFGNAVASAIYTDTENRKVLNRNQGEFDKTITAEHSTFKEYDLSDQPEQYWKAGEVQKDDPLIGIGKSIDKVDIFGSIQSTAAKDLKTALGDMANGLTITPTATSSLGYHRVTITAKNGKEIVLKTYFGKNDKESKAKEKERLLEWLKNNATSGTSTIEGTGSLNASNRKK